MKVRDCLALLRPQFAEVDANERIRAMQALINAEKLHLLTEKERRMIDQYIKWGHITPKGYARLPLIDEP